MTSISAMMVTNAPQVFISGQLSWLQFAKDGIEGLKSHIPKYSTVICNKWLVKTKMTLHAKCVATHQNWPPALVKTSVEMHAKRP